MVHGFDLFKINRLILPRDGNDGPWSTFNFRIGSQREVVRLLPNLAYQYLQLVPREGCPDAMALSNCSGKRGNLFHPENSRTWRPTPINTAIDASRGGPNGTDNVLVGPESPTTALKDQVISLQSDMRAFIGMVGISGDDSAGSLQGLLASTVQITNIPKAWSYTAGCANSTFIT
jgi:hypothetical protein